MISILIPVFNRNVVALVTSLHKQLDAVKEKAEIVVMDDASTDEPLKNTNKILSGFNNVQYIELPANAGRNIIRHKLAAVAKYETLIFLDADSSFPDECWLQRYAGAVSGEAIIMGGRLYNAKEPGTSTLHFHYGKLREQTKACIRNKHPYRSFLACNFLISKQQLSRLIIDDHLHGYCHEDTFMGLQFEKLGLTVKHIDNPVYHEGIDNDEVFMEKQQEALENLHYLYTTYNRAYHFNTEIKLLRIYKKIKSIPAGKYVLDKMADREQYFRKKVLQSHYLFWLDCWKLAALRRLSFKKSV
jgi:glycosyltransferase involved in cell wall biosynthesis